MFIKSIIMRNRWLYNFARDIVDFYGNIKIELFIRKYKKNPQKYRAKLTKNNRYVSITKGKYRYQTFSAFYLNNMIGLMLECLMRGDIPIIEYKIDSNKKSNNWTDFFDQSISLNCDNIVKKEMKKSNNIYKPAFKYIYDKKKVQLWGYIYNEFVIFNKETQKYIEDEYKKIILGKRVLGVICRGTDYTKTKPKYHPIQPDVNQIISDAKRIMKEYGYEYIYLATEDETYYNLFAENFGKYVLTNKREYYDKEYNKLGENALLFSVDLGREEEQYKKGLEYLSSIVLLSKCNALIGGHCGGSDMAIYFNNCEYDYVNIYDCGVY